MSGNNVTMFGWVDFATATAATQIAGNGNVAGGTGMELQSCANGSAITGVQFIIGVGGSTSKTSGCGSETLTQGTWYFVAGTFNGTTLSVYVNGTLLSSVTGSSNISYGSCDMYLGEVTTTAACAPGSSATAFKGDLADFGVFSSTLSATQLLTLYEGSTSFPPSGLPSSATASPAWCISSGCAPIKQQLGNDVSYSYVTGGWCVQSGSAWGNQSGSATLGTTPYPQYFVVVKVAWGPHALQTTAAGVLNSIPSAQSLVLATSVATPASYLSQVPTTAPVNSCPVGSAGLT